MCCLHCGLLQALEWLGIDWDDGPYFQTERFDLYAEYIAKLIQSGHAYYCTCSQEKIDAMRKAEKKPKPPVEHLFTDVYEEMPPSLQSQWNELQAHMEKYPEEYKL